ncbi:serine--tRNA ligase [Candidatus Woesebacteria bacterium]|nr:serine--tRNA ligase [Candidatus Woesebacteria bacterium]
MISLDLLRQNPNSYKEAAKNKNREVDIDRILVLDGEVAKLDTQVQEIRAERNKLAALGKTDPEGSRAKGKELKEKLKVLEEQYSQLHSELQTLLSQVPNLPLPEVPVGTDESGNAEIKKVGDIPKFGFTPKDHLTLGKDLDIIDTERGSKVSGYRGYFLKNKAAVLQNAVLLYVMQKLMAKGYTPIVAPAIVKGFTLYGTGQFPWGEKEVYKLNDEDAYLAGTAEQPVTSYYANEILPESELPKKFVAFSPCYRREAGSYGKDTKGIYRLHEFFKIEQVVLCKNDIEVAKSMHDELQQNCEEILQDLELPYRVLLMCTGDMGEPQMKKYDTESWMPSRQAYGETMSNSIMGDFQTRRLNIRYKTAEGKTEYCYSLNNTALASPRILIALLENHQQEDGSIKIPHKLQAICGFSKIEKNG